jgi:hypothetical protein
MRKANPKLKKLLTKYTFLSIRDIELLFNEISICTLTRGEDFIPFDGKKNHISIVLEGGLKGYHKKNEEEKVVQLFYKDDLLIKTNKEIAEPLFVQVFSSSCKVMLLDYDSVVGLARENEGIRKLHSIILFEGFMRLTKLNELFYKYDIENRYDAFVEQFVKVKTPDKYIASVLGLTPSYLATIKKERKMP